jgi:choline dehydrogenase-like flavoprotein
MRPMVNEPEFDVIIIGSGIAGALAAYRLALARHRVLIIEAGGVAPDSIGRWAMAHNYWTSPSKSPDSPFCGNDVLPIDPTIQPPGYPYVQPNPIGPQEPDKSNYYVYRDPVDRQNPNRFKSYYERLVGGSTWHWQGIYIRMLPNDFRMATLYGRGFDWPISYNDIERWYVDAEYEMGVAGSDAENTNYYQRRFGAFRSKPFPMPALAPSYLDKQVAASINGKTLPGFRTVPLQVNTVPHAINSRSYDQRPACDGHTSCVPLCPTKARYEAIIHIEKAIKAGATLRTKAVVTKLQLDDNRRNVTRVFYKRWDGTEDRASGRIIVLAANGIENPRILVSSDAANRSDAVGRYLMDHPIKQSYALARRPLYPFRGPQTTSDIAAFRDGPFRRQFAGFKTSIKNDGWSSVSATITAPRGNVIPDPHPDKPNKGGTVLDFVENEKLFGPDLQRRLREHATHQITLNSACEQLPVRDNRVSLANDKLDHFGIPRPAINYRLYDDQNYVGKCFETILEVHKLVFKLLGVNDAKDQFLQELPDAYGGSGHIMGTTIMGADPTKSVVDKDCRAHDHPNLFVLGSSVFPTGSTANPTSTIAALALRAAETIKTQLKG